MLDGRTSMSCDPLLLELCMKRLREGRNEILKIRDTWPVMAGEGHAADQRAGDDGVGDDPFRIRSRARVGQARAQEKSTQRIPNGMLNGERLHKGGQPRFRALQV